MADLIAFYDEEIDCTKDLTIYHQSDIWKFKTIEAIAIIKSDPNSNKIPIPLNLSP